MKGHVRERPPGSGNWYAVFDVKDEVGKRKRKWHSLDAKGKREAQIECARLMTEMRSGSYVEPKKTTVAQYLDRWLEHIRPNVSPRTHERYVELCRKNIVPLVGAVILSRLQMLQVSEAYAKALKTGRRDGKGGLSPRTVHHMHRVLKQAMSQAVRWNLIVRNPADIEKTARPKIEKKPVATVDPAETVKLMEAARERRLFVPIVLATACGLRRGEITALRWKSIDLDRGQLAVVASTEQTKGKGNVREKATKSEKCRTVAMPSFLVDELRAWRAQQAQDLLRLGVRLSDDYHVVTKADGSPIQPRSLTHSIMSFMKRQKASVRLHGLRHSHASHMLASNIHPKVVQERLGHSTITVTMDIYSHLMPNIQQGAADSVDAVLREAMRKASENS